MHCRRPGVSLTDWMLMRSYDGDDTNKRRRRDDKTWKTKRGCRTSLLLCQPSSVGHKWHSPFTTFHLFYDIKPSLVDLKHMKPSLVDHGKERHKSSIAVVWRERAHPSYSRVSVLRHTLLPPMTPHTQSHYHTNLFRHRAH